MLDRSVFVRPIAHRGLHDIARGIVENSALAFEAALAKGYGIECDLRPASDGTAMVFHDRQLHRLVDAPGLVTDHSPAALRKMRYRAGATTILSLADLLDLVGGRVPLLIEVKSEWERPAPEFIKSIADGVRSYRGPLALMSFDPAMIAALKMLVPDVPRGIVSGVYEGDGWWLDVLDAERAYRLTHLLESREAEPHFFAYHVKALPTPETRFIREGLGMPLFTWTVRTAEDRATAARWADAPIFETYEP